MSCTKVVHRTSPERNHHLGQAFLVPADLAFAQPLVLLLVLPLSIATSGDSPSTHQGSVSPSVLCSLPAATAAAEAHAALLEAAASDAETRRQAVAGLRDQV